MVERMIKAHGEIVQPDSIEVTLTLTMPIRDWKSIATALKRGDWWPDGKTASLIHDVIRKMTANVTEIAQGE